MSSLNEIEYLPMNDDWLWEKNNDQKSIQLKSLFLKWNLFPDLTLKSFAVSSQLQKKDEITAIKKMFTDVTVLSLIGLPESDTVFPEILVQPLSCSVTNLKWFDKLIDADIISSNGFIRGCYGEEIDGIWVQDKLRLMCAKDNEGEHILNGKDRKEFLFHLLKLVCIGGAKCQCEDNFHPLKDAIKMIYKELIKVKKDTSGTTTIVSSVYEVDIQGNSSTIFPFPQNIHNKCYVIITGHKVTLLLKKFAPFW